MDRLEVSVTPFVKCSNCSSGYRNSVRDHLAHIFSKCLRIKTGETARRKTISFILKYISKSLMKNKLNYNNIDIVQNSSTYKLLRMKPQVKLDLLIPVIEACQCPVCEEHFISMKQGYIHLFSYCLDTEKSSDGIGLMCILDRIRREHRDVLIDDYLFSVAHVCKYCREILPDIETVKKHYEYHASEPRPLGHVCGVCNFLATDEQLLVRHVLRAHVDCVCVDSNCGSEITLCEDEHQCPICERKLSTEVFMPHLENCRPFTADSLITCKFCGKDVTELDAHLFTHLDDGTELDFEGSRETNEIDLEVLLHHKMLLSQEDRAIVEEISKSIEN